MCRVDPIHLITSTSLSRVGCHLSSSQPPSCWATLGMKGKIKMGGLNMGPDRLVKQNSNVCLGLDMPKQLNLASQPTWTNYLFHPNSFLLGQYQDNLIDTVAYGLANHQYQFVMPN